MKTTGIIRRIDSLGRVVLPKEIRKTMRLKEGDFLSISIDNERMIFDKYSPLSNFLNSTKKVADSLFRVIDKPILIVDTVSVVAACGSAKKLLNEKLSESTVKAVEEGSSFILNSDGGACIRTITASGDESNFFSQIIIAVKDMENRPLGAVVVFDERLGGRLSSVELKAAEFAAKLLSCEAE